MEPVRWPASVASIAPSASRVAQPDQGIVVRRDARPRRHRSPGRWGAVRGRPTADRRRPRSSRSPGPMSASRSPPHIAAEGGLDGHPEPVDEQRPALLVGGSGRDHRGEVHRPPAELTLHRRLQLHPELRSEWKSTSSNTEWTIVPKAVPAGRSASGLAPLGGGDVDGADGRRPVEREPGSARPVVTGSAASCSSPAPRSDIDASWGSKRPTDAWSTMAENDHRWRRRSGRWSSVATASSGSGRSAAGGAHRSVGSAASPTTPTATVPRGRLHQGIEVGHRIPVDGDRDLRRAERLGSMAAP